MEKVKQEHREYITLSAFLPFSHKFWQKIGTVLGVEYWVLGEISFDCREIDTHFCILRGPLCGREKNHKTNN